MNFFEVRSQYHYIWCWLFDVLTISYSITWFLMRVQCIPVTYWSVKINVSEALIQCLEYQTSNNNTSYQLFFFHYICVVFRSVLFITPSGHRTRVFVSETNFTQIKTQIRETFYKYFFLKNEVEVLFNKYFVSFYDVFFRKLRDQNRRLPFHHDNVTQIFLLSFRHRLLLCQMPEHLIILIINN